MEKSIKSKEHQVIANLLYQLRTANGLKQADLADLLGEPQSFVSKYENGERRLDLVELRTILFFLNTDLIEFAQALEIKLSKT
jgi:transcriptional regulator with XRE-family HTH domain